MNSNAYKLIFFLLVFLFITPVFVFAGGEFKCAWDSSLPEPCYYVSDTCDGGDIPGDCKDVSNNSSRCENEVHECVDNPKAINLQRDYPPIPTPYGYIDLDELAARGEVDISTIVVFLYAISIWLGGLLAFIGLLFAGFTYIWAGANPSAKNKAKRRFVNVLWGLAIILGANVIVTVINPNILKLEFPDVFVVEADAPLYVAQNHQLESKTTTEPAIAENHSSCLWDSHSGASPFCRQIDRCEDGFAPNIVCSAFNDDKEACETAGEEDYACVSEDGGGEDSSVAGTFDCVEQDPLTCVAPSIPMPEYNCNSGYVPDSSKCGPPGVLGCATGLTCVSEGEDPEEAGTFLCTIGPGNNSCVAFEPGGASGTECNAGYAPDESVCDALSPQTDGCGGSDTYPCKKALP